MLPFSIMFSDAQVLPFWTVIYNSSESGDTDRCWVITSASKGAPAWRERTPALGLMAG